MKEQLKLALVQADQVWEDKAANLEYFSSLLQGVEPGTDVIVLPEMFTTGFSMSSELLAEPVDGPTTNWMKQMALQKNSHLTGSFICHENGNFYNRALWVTPSGVMKHYDKRHLFGMAGEHEHYSAGKERVVVECDGWRLLLQICYDLRFPEWARNNVDYHGIIYMAQWPEARIAHWDALLRARAIENQCYVAAVNRVGQDGLGKSYCGHSQAISPYGVPLQEPVQAIGIYHVTFSKTHLLEIRQNFPFLHDQNRYELML